MREVFQKLLLKQDGHQMLPEAFGNIRDRLAGQEIQEEGIIFILQELAKRIGDASTVSDEQVIVVTKEIIQEQLASVTRTSPRIGRDVKYAFFFGPTGVGKTTTIAKLAADAMLKERRKVGFITTDTFRIGAVEQLKTYANILNVPIEVVFSAKDLTASMEKLAHCDLIFVDTAGRNFRNSEYVQGIAALVEQGASSENYLVLSLTSRYNDMKTIIDNFQDVPIQKVIFTKADETMVYGSILNVARSFEIPLSYITVGQNVPDDIVSASPEVVSKLIVGEESYA
ncbi:MAG: flagellar biosynthesis protein FlhF, partial [Clostridia bacterium]